MNGVTMHLRTILFVAAIALTACRDDPTSDLVIADHIIIAQAGYSVPRPERFDVQTSGRGVRLTEGGNLRSPRSISVRATDGTTAFEDVTDTRDGTPYAIADTGAGSGGTVWELTALKPLEGVTVSITATYQSETASADFDWVWPVVDGIALVK